MAVHTPGMKPLAAHEIRGNWATLLLPIQPDDAIDFGLLGDEIEQFIAFWIGHIAPLITRDGLSPMAADKAAAVAGGWLPGLATRVRWPYRSVAPDVATHIGALARRELPELF
jgi:hypothetical protein